MKIVTAFLGPAAAGVVVWFILRDYGMSNGNAMFWATLAALVLLGFIGVAERLREPEGSEGHSAPLLSGEPLSPEPQGWLRNLPERSEEVRPPERPAPSVGLDTPYSSPAGKPRSGRRSPQPPAPQSPGPSRPARKRRPRRP